jgi:pimeloyl-ACP methyl ester carboxylesterase
MGGATLTDEVSHLILYEPGLGLIYPPGSIDAIEEAVAAGDPEDALVQIYRRVLTASDDDIAALRTSPMWDTQVSTAHTVTRECRVEETWEYRPGQFERLTVPTLFLAGSESPGVVGDCTRKAMSAIPRARVEVLDGHAHAAHKTHPELVASIIHEFVV